MDARLALVKEKIATMSDNLAEALRYYIEVYVPKVAEWKQLNQQYQDVFVQFRLRLQKLTQDEYVEFSRLIKQ